MHCLGHVAFFGECYMYVHVACGCGLLGILPHTRPLHVHVHHDHTRPLNPSTVFELFFFHSLQIPVHPSVVLFICMHACSDSNCSGLLIVFAHDKAFGMRSYGCVHFAGMLFCMHWLFFIFGHTLRTHKTRKMRSYVCLHCCMYIARILPHFWQALRMQNVLQTACCVVYCCVVPLVFIFACVSVSIFCAKTHATCLLTCCVPFVSIWISLHALVRM